MIHSDIWNTAKEEEQSKEKDKGNPTREKRDATYPSNSSDQTEKPETVSSIISKNLVKSQALLGEEEEEER